jgi:hypothetical protein
VDAQAGLDPFWLQTHYVGFVMASSYVIHNQIWSREALLVSVVIDYGH